MQEDEELVIRILNGELNAFRLLIGRYERLVIHMVGRIISRKEEREDICQEVFLKVYKNLPKFKFESKLSTWIAKIAYSTAINYADKLSNRPHDELTGLEKSPSGNLNPEAMLSKKETYIFLHEEINKLPLQYRTILTMYHINELSYQEIEEITKIPAGTIKSHLFRARKLLKEKLEIYLN